MSQYFTPAEAKALVRLSEEQIFKRFPPAYVLERPLPAMDRATGKRCNVPPGVYEIDVFPGTFYVDGERDAVTLREMEWRDGVALVNEFIAYAPYSEEALDDRPDWMKACPPGALAPIESEGEDSPLAPLTDIVDLESLDDDLTPGGSDNEGYRDDPDFGYDDNRLWPRGYVRTRRFVLRGDPIEVSKDEVVFLRSSILSYLAKKGKNAPEILAGAETEEAVAPLAGGEQPETPAAGLNEGEQGRSDEAQPLPPSEALRSKQRRYCTPQEKREAKKTILPRIHQKIGAGVKWHHCTEVDRYMTEKGILGDKRSGLIGAVKKALRENEIPRPTGKPLKS